jgi:hypothetical protein
VGRSLSVGEAERRWLSAWKIAAPELENMRVEELRSLTEEQAALLFEGLDFEPGDVWLPEDRINSVGLIEQQRLFMRSREHPASLRRRP